MSWIESDAIVLRHVKQGDTSRVVTLFARDSGKLAVMAKGSRKPGGRFGSGLGLFHLSQIQYRPRANRDLVFLNACEPREGFEQITQDVFGYASAGVCAELVDRLVPEGAASEEIFDLLLEALRVLSETVPLPEGQEMRAVAFPVAFQMKLMDCLGVAPELSECTACGATDLGSSSSLSPKRGGLLCTRCRAAEGGRRLGEEALAFLRTALYGDLSAVMSSPSPPNRGVTLEMRAAVDALLEYHQHVRVPSFRSRRFLDDLWQPGG